MDHTHAPPTETDIFGPNTGLIRSFLRRLEALDMEDLGIAIRVWRDEVSDGWHEADRAVAAAIATAGRHREQERVLEALYDVFRRAPWFTAEHPGSRIAASDATAQYIATSALLALLVRDQLAPAHLERLYRPFSTVISISDLDPERDTGRPGGRDDRPDAR